MKNIKLKILKITKLIRSRKFIIYAFYKLIPSFEHENILANLPQLNSIVDIGANKGQFTAIAREIFNHSRIFSFEPLDAPSKVFLKLLGNDELIKFFKYGIGPISQKTRMHVSKRDDSSSVLPISNLQSFYFPGTEEKKNISIEMRKLDDLLTEKDITKPSLLKIDVQGFELEVLKGSELLLKCFDYIYVECSFVELYQGQALVHQIISYLQDKSFYLNGVYNLFYDKKGKAIQADFMFSKV